MRKPDAYAVIMSPDAATVNFDRLRCETIPEGTFEADVYFCCHCNRAVHVKPGAVPEELGSMCRACMKMVCPKCAAGPCVPFLKKLDLWEAKERALRSYGF
jgi:hypothetical protein